MSSMFSYGGTSGVHNIFYVYHYQKNTITLEHVWINKLTEIIV